MEHLEKPITVNEIKGIITVSLYNECLQNPWRFDLRNLQMRLQVRCLDEMLGKSSKKSMKELLAEFIEFQVDFVK